METAGPSDSRICRLLERTPPRWVLLSLLCAVLVVRGRVMLDAPAAFSTDPDSYALVAFRWFEDGALAMHWDNRSSPRAPIPTAVRAPLYPLVLAATFFSGFATRGVLGALHVALGTLTVVGTWHLGRLWQLPAGVCLIGATLVTVDPILLVHSTELMTETLATFLAVATLIALTYCAGANSTSWAMVAGLLAGLCVLCRPEFLVWLIAAAVAFPFVAQRSRKPLRLGVYLAAAALTLAPWAIRNYRVFERPIITTTHGGFTLLLANNPDYYEHLRSAPWGTVWDGQPVYQQWLEKRGRAPGQTPDNDPRSEVSDDRWAYRQAFAHIRAEPGMFLWSCLVRVGRLWSVLPHQVSEDESTTRRGLRYAVAIFYAFEFVLAAAGAWFLRRKLLAAPWVWGTLLVLSITAVHVFYWTDMRMRAPLASVVALAAASGLATLACRKPAASRLVDEA